MRCNERRHRGHLSHQRRFAVVLVALLLAVPGCLVGETGARSAQEITGDGLEQRVERLLARMTLAEKVGQLNQRSLHDKGALPEIQELLRQGGLGSVLNHHGAEAANELQRIAVGESRLGIPLIFGLDVIYGYRTIFPIPLAQSCSWDPELVQEAKAVAAREAAADGVHWTFGPMVDVARDPRWGRIAEGSGEDPYLGAAMAAASVRGFQGTDLSSPETLLACPKHYVAYGLSEAGRDYAKVDVSEKSLREVFLPPFDAAIRDAGALSIMSAFNTINGIPASANPLTLKTILREEWGFTGFVVSDWGCIEELVVHGFAADEEEAVVQAISNGIDMEMESGLYVKNLVELVGKGKVSEQWINESVRRILRVKFMLGLFDRPYFDPQRAEKEILREEHVAFAREVAGRSIVLLKNDKALLPLSKDLESVAVIGPLADDKESPLGLWSNQGDPEDVVTVLEGVRAAVSPGSEVRYVQGGEIDKKATAGFEEAVSAAGESEVALLVLGEGRRMSGEAGSRTDLGLPGSQLELLQAVHATGTPVVVVLIAGRPLTIPWLDENVAAIVEGWQLGIQSGEAIADVLFGDTNPSGKLTASFPRNVGQIPIYYSHESSGRPITEENRDERYISKYLDSPNTPLYSFGHGLSYTRFEYENLRLSHEGIGTQGTIEVRVDVANVGSRPGDEIVQLYIHDVAASVVRPVKELKGFTRISLMPGEKKTVSMTLGPRELGFYNRHMEWVVEPGRFKVWVGPSSVSGLEAGFEAVK
ncbi:MAG: beta-glucosidase BglX [bacterium]|nr:beta-glucosidase BglX [bacterium]